MIFRLIDTGKRSAAENISIDEILLRGCGLGKTPNTIRFLKFEPCVLVGFNQSVEQEVREMYCKTRGIAINRRITGGGALYFDEPQIGWEIVSKRENFPGNIDSLYEKICKGACRGLKKLGLDACYRPKNDIEVRGRKISGTGGAIEGDSFLFQGTLLTDFDVEGMIKSLRIPTEKLKDKEIESVKERVTCLRWELGYLPDEETIKRALVEGFCESFGIECEEGELNKWEKRELKLRKEYYSSEAWIRGNREVKRGVLSCLRKTRGGLVRVQLVADIEKKRISYAMITGDFFLEPRRAIYDLESMLKDQTLVLSEIKRNVLDFLERRKVEIHGIRHEEFVDIILDAARKCRLQRLGLSAEDSSRIFTVCKSFERIKEPSYLLIPYCAKLPECKYRNKEGCVICGNCTVGEAFRLATEYSLVPLTVKSFEDLMKKLKMLKKKDAEYIGCCCEAFYAKHEEDMRSLGVPGILIDIDNLTCYDLNRAREARLGLFESHTNLKIDILERVLSSKFGKLRE
ncbi:MAG: biotin/lipoate A/B protein ligase family protein [Thermoplasmata archaeon]